MDLGSREQRLQSVLHTYLQAVDRGERPDRQALLNAHPDLRDELSAYFADASKMERLAKSLRTAAFQTAPSAVRPALTPEELAARLPQFEILELLGQGGMGAVYKARQKGLDRIVALKILPVELGGNAAFVERFTREAKALARLNHPNIVGVYDVGQTPDGLCYFVMEFIDGVNLRQAMRVGAMSPREALAIVPQVCDALQYAHDEGIVHRDIKPENVLLDKKGRVKIADFGLAKLLGTSDSDASLTGTHQVMGTLRYMAPEQMEGAKAVDHRADIYSLGVVFYELLTGEVPMGRFAPPSKKVQIDVRLDEVVLRALEREPEQRWQQASDVKSEVEAISRHQPIVDATSARNTSEVSSRPNNSHWPVVGVLLAFALLFALVGVVFGLVWATVGFAEAAVWGSLTWLAGHVLLLFWLPRGTARPALWTSWTLACVAVYFTLWMADAPHTSWWCQGLGYIDRHYWPYEGKSKCSVTMVPKDKTFLRVTITNEREIRRNGYGSRGVVNWSGPSWAGERTRDDYSIHLDRLQGQIALVDVNAKGFRRRWAGAPFTWEHDRAFTAGDLAELVSQDPIQRGKHEEMKEEELEVLNKQSESLLRLMRTAQSDDDASGSWKRDSRPVGYLAFFVGRDELEASLKGTPFYWLDYVGTHDYSFKPKVSILYVGVPMMVAVWLAGLLFLIRSRMAFWFVLTLFLVNSAAAAFGIVAVFTEDAFGQFIPRETKAPSKADNPSKSSRPAPPPLPPPPPNLEGPRATESLDLGNGVKLDLVLIPAGTFVMGAGPGEEKHRRHQVVDLSWEKPAHTVTIARPFYMGKYEVTQAQWLAVMGKAPGSRVTLEAETDPQKFGNFPIEDINLQETLDFCTRASQRTQRTIRLPSEAEWEYACRGGTTTYYFFGNSMQRDLGDGEHEIVLRHYMRNDVNDPYEVGKYKPNPWGLYDILGNVAERCADTTSARNYVGAPTDGSPWMADGQPATNVIRGTWDPRSAARTAFQSVNFHSKTLGMRVVMEVSPRETRP